MARKFLVLHSADNYDKGNINIIYTDSITAIRPTADRQNDETKIIGTTIYVDNWCWNVQEPIADIMKRIKELET